MGEEIPFPGIEEDEELRRDLGAYRETMSMLNGLQKIINVYAIQEACAKRDRAAAALASLGKVVPRVVIHAERVGAIVEVQIETNLEASESG